MVSQSPSKESFHPLGTAIAEHAPSRSAAAVAAVAAAVLGLALFWTVAAIDVPKAATDAELLRWWQQGPNRTAGLVSGIAALFVAVSFPVVSNYVTALTATSRAPHWRAFARSMVAAVTAVWLVTGAVRASVSRSTDVMDSPLPGADSLRVVTAVNYALLGLSGMAVLALSMLAISVVVLRTDALPRWVAVIGLGFSLLILAATLAQYGQYLTLLAVGWAFCLSLAIWRGRTSEPSQSDGHEPMEANGTQ